MDFDDIQSSRGDKGLEKMEAQPHSVHSCLAENLYHPNGNFSRLLKGPISFRCDGLFIT